jgi:hypothetical protein
MEAITGVFRSPADAQHAVDALLFHGIPADKITLLTPGSNLEKLETVPVDAGEQPGIGKAIGAVVGAAGALSTGFLVAAIIPGVGLVTAAGVLGAAILTAAGASVGAVAGSALENSGTKGLPEGEIFVYEDALRRGRTIVMALAGDPAEVPRLRELLKSEGAETVDAARQEWWLGLRSEEREHYTASGGDFSTDEKFYRLGFEAALHSRRRCQEFDQVSAEMANDIEELERQHPGAQVAEAYTRGYQRGRDYYARFCSDQTRAA